MLAAPTGAPVGTGPLAGPSAPTPLDMIERAMNLLERATQEADPGRAAELVAEARGLLADPKT